MGLLQQKIHIVQILIVLGKILLHYSRKKDLQSPSEQILSKQFLDVSFKLATKRYFHFQKVNNTSFYINVYSNHPPTIIKHLPKMINKMISDLSCNKEEFDKVKSLYESVLKDRGYFLSMSYNHNTTQNNRRNRNRKVILFNPPYSQNVKTNIGTLLMKLVRNQFPKNNKYYKIFSLNTLKLSYCSTTNVGSIIKQHNCKVLSKTNNNNNRKYNCRSKPNCPWNGQCLYSMSVIQSFIYIIQQQLCLLCNF